jgi:hypothetical protein
MLNKTLDISALRDSLKGRVSQKEINLQCAQDGVALDEPSFTF